MDSSEDKSVQSDLKGNSDADEVFFQERKEKKNPEMSFLLASLKNHFIFYNHSDAELENVALKMIYCAVPVDTVIFAEGSKARYFFLIEKGTVQVGDGHERKTLRVGDGFGQRALLYREPRKSYAKASENCCLWAIDRDTYRASVEEVIIHQFEERRKILEHVPFFAGLSNRQKDIICGAMISHCYVKGRFLIEEGEPGSSLYVLVEGSASVWKAGKVVGKMGKHDSFGEKALFFNTVRQVSVKAEEDTTCLVVLRDTLVKLFGEEIFLITICSFMKKAVQKTMWLSRLPRPKIEEILDLMQIVNYKSGGVVVRRNEESVTHHKLVIVFQGALKRNKTTVALAQAGQLFGEDWLVDSRTQRHEDDIVMEGDGVVAEIRIETVKSLLEGPIDQVVENAERKQARLMTEKARLRNKQIEGLEQLFVLRELKKYDVSEESRVQLNAFPNRNGLLRWNFAHSPIPPHVISSVVKDAENQSQKIIEQAKRREAASGLRRKEGSSSLRSGSPFRQRLKSKEEISLEILAKTAQLHSDRSITKQIETDGGGLAEKGDQAANKHEQRADEHSQTTGSATIESVSQPPNEGRNSWEARQKDHRDRAHRASPALAGESAREMPVSPMSGRDIHGQMSGSNAFVLLVGCKTEPEHHRLFVLKCYSRAILDDSSLLKYKNQEKALLRALYHPFLLEYYRSFKDEGHYFSLVEFIQGEELYSALRSIGLLSSDDARFYIASIILLLEYLLNQGVYPRDLRPENFMVDRRGFLKMIKLTSAKVSKSKNAAFAKTYTLIGTPHYMAPEVINGRGYTFYICLYALGVLLFEMLCGFVPFGDRLQDPLEIYEEILNVELRFPKNIKDQKAIKLMTQLLNKSDPDSRMGGGTFEHLKNHPFLEQVPWEDLAQLRAEPPKWHRRPNVNRSYEELLRELDTAPPCLEYIRAKFSAEELASPSFFGDW